MYFLNCLNLFIFRNFRSTENTWDKNFRKFCRPRWHRGAYFTWLLGTLIVHWQYNTSITNALYYLVDAVKSLFQISTTNIPSLDERVSVFSGFD
jgi:hypothetical protein